MSPDSSDAVLPPESELVESSVAAPRWPVDSEVSSPSFIGVGRVTEVAWKPETASYWCLVDWRQHHASDVTLAWVDESMLVDPGIS